MTGRRLHTKGDGRAWSGGAALHIPSRYGYPICGSDTRTRWDNVPEGWEGMRDCSHCARIDSRPPLAELADEVYRDGLDATAARHGFPRTTLQSWLSGRVVGARARDISHDMHVRPPLGRWVLEGPCRGDDRFLSDHPDDIAEAKQVCGGCPVRLECLNVAIEGREWGVWGGTTDKERRQLKVVPA